MAAAAAETFMGKLLKLRIVRPRNTAGCIDRKT